MTKPLEAGSAIFVLALLAASAARADEAAPAQPKPDVSAGVGALMQAILGPLDAATRPINQLAKPITGSTGYAPPPAEPAELSKRSSITPGALQQTDTDKLKDLAAPSR